MCVCVRECEFKFFFGSLDLSGADGDGVGEAGGQKSSQNSFFFASTGAPPSPKGVGMLPKTHTHTHLKTHVHEGWKKGKAGPISKSTPAQTAFEEDLRESFWGF